MRYVILFGVLVAASPAYAGGQQSYDILNDRGQRQATVRPDNAGNLDVIDTRGRRQFTVTPDGDVRDLNGRRTSTVKPSTNDADREESDTDE